MKTFMILALLALAIPALAQDKNAGKFQTDTFRVEGVCGMCKERIENAALIKGVKLAEWDRSSHNLVVIYNPALTTPEQVQSRIAAAGHDTEQIKATEEQYKKVHKCCRYRELESH